MSKRMDSVIAEAEFPAVRARSESRPYIAQDERMLIARACAGQQRALREFYSTYQRQVRSHLFRLLGPDSDIDDMVQTVFVNAFLALKRFKGDSAVSTWLYRITANSTHNLLRKRFRRERAKAALLRFNVSRQAHLHSGNIDARDEAQRILLRLQPKLRETFVLYHYEGLTLHEISQVLEKPVSTVGDRLSRARKKLRELIST